MVLVNITTQTMVAALKPENKTTDKNTHTGTGDYIPGQPEKQTEMEGVAAPRQLGQNDQTHRNQPMQKQFHLSQRNNPLMEHNKAHQAPIPYTNHSKDSCCCCSMHHPYQFLRYQTLHKSHAACMPTGAPLVVPKYTRSTHIIHSSAHQTML